MSDDVHLLLVHEPRPPVEVELFRNWFRRHHDYWRTAARMLGLRASFVTVNEAVKTAVQVEQLSATIVWCDLPPLPPAQHTELCEELWGKGVSVLVPPQAYVGTWDLSHWYPRLQNAFVRQPPTAIVETAADFSDPSKVTVLERTLRAMETIGKMPRGEGAREILRPWFGWSPLFDLDGMAPWEVAATGKLARLGPFLVQQQENWGLPVGGVALQWLPPHPPVIPAIRVYVIGGAPVWWSARNRELKGSRAASHRLWTDGEPDSFAATLAELAQEISRALGATEFVFETASLPGTHVVDVRPINTVLEPVHGAHLATLICLAAYLRGLALGEGPADALRQLPPWETIADGIARAGHSLEGHGPFHLGPAGDILKPPLDAARGAGSL